jgi:hypothetical protein
MPRKDPIIEEIHGVRDAIARETGYDLDKMLEAARARQKASGRQAVRLSPKPSPSKRHHSWPRGRQWWHWLLSPANPIQLSPAEERELLEAMEYIRRGDYVDGEDLLNELRALRF